MLQYFFLSKSSCNCLFCDSTIERDINDTAQVGSKKPWIHKRTFSLLYTIATKVNPKCRGLVSQMNNTVSQFVLSTGQYITNPLCQCRICLSSLHVDNNVVNGNFNVLSSFVGLQTVGWLI